MTLPLLRDLVSNSKRVRFVRFEGNALWYQCDSGFEFPVPVGVSETDGATFLAEDKASFFMRWMRQHLSMLEQAEQEQATAQATSPFLKGTLTLSVK